jgi:hypothetical protein
MQTIGCLALLLLAAPAAFAEAPEQPRRLAVVPLRLSGEGLSAAAGAELEESVRGALAEAGSPWLRQVGAEEVARSLRGAPECPASCEVERGKLLGAALVVGGELRGNPGRLELSLRLSDTASGELLSAATLTSPTLDGLRAALPAAAKVLLAPVRDPRANEGEPAISGALPGRSYALGRLAAAPRLRSAGQLWPHLRT